MSPTGDDHTLTDAERETLGIAWFGTTTPEQMFDAVERILAGRAGKDAGECRPTPTP